MTKTTLLLSRLRDSSILAGWQVDELKRIGDPQALGRQLLQRGWLTPFQVNQALTGKWDNLIVGPYVLQERLGAGGMGQVFKAWHLYLARTAAVKIIRKERCHEPSVIGRFRREMQAVAQLSHPNIVTAFDADEVNGILYLAMEYVEGITLGQLVRQQGPMPIAEACACIHQAALGLRHVEACGLVHRDIKPSNLLVTPPRGDGRRELKILDLGLARLDEPTDDDGGTLTKPGMVIGTPDFIAPEQATDPRRADIRSDLYSLGCTFYYVVTGSVPFPGGTTLEKVIWHRSQEPTPVESLRPGLSGPVTAIIRRLMAKEPDERYASPADLIADLDQLLTDGPDTLTDLGSKTYVGVPSLTQLTPTIALQVKRRRWTDWRLLTAAGLLVLLAVWLAWRAGPAGPAAAVPGPVQPRPGRP